MSAVQVIAQLSTRLDPADTARALAALRQDELIWREISRPGLVEQVAALSGSDLSQWAPANFALAALGYSLADNDQPMLNPASLSPEHLETALALLDSLAETAPDGLNIEMAGQVALALRERFLVSHNWEHVFAQSGLADAADLEPASNLWRAAFACLYPLLHDPGGMLVALSRHLAVGVRWAVHTLLANPASEMRQVERHLAVLPQLTPEQQIAWLKCLQAHHQPDLARPLAQSLAVSPHPAYANLLEDLPFCDETLTQVGERLARFQQAAVINQIAGYADRSVRLLTSARELTTRALAQTVIRQSGAAGLPVQGDCSPEWIQSALTCETIQADLGLLPFTPPWNEILLSIPTGEALHPFLALRKAELLAARGERALGQEVARQAAQRLTVELREGRLAPSPFAWDAVQTLVNLVHLELVDEAAQLASAVITIRPADIAFLAAAGQVFELQGELSQAIDLAVLCAALDPSEPDRAGHLAELFESAGQWQAALTERERWLALLTEPAAADRLRVAFTAIQAGSLPRAVQLCEQVLSGDPDSGSAYALLGQASLAAGNPQEAVAHLSQATLLAPDQPEPWLQLAEVLRGQNQSQQALETLRAAVMAAPGSAGLAFALGQACLREQLPSEALTALREASRLEPDSADIAAAYAGVLHDLGHTAEASALLRQARHRWPAHAQLAGVEGRILLDCGKLEESLPAFETALKADNPDPVWNLGYARALLRDDRQGIPGAVEPERLEKAVQALEAASTQLDNHFEASLLMAEALRAQGSTEQSFEFYRRLVDRPEAAGMAWRWRVQAGFGQVALVLDQVETAVAALREAAGARPADLTIQHLLAEAYLKADLRSQSAQTARQALLLDPESLANLAWYIDLMTQLGLEAETLNALAAATRLAPHEPCYWNRLARLQQQRGDEAAVRAALQALLGCKVLTAADLHAAAETYAALGDLSMALSSLERALAVTRGLPVSLLVEIAVLHQRLGQTEIALETLEQAIMVAPDELELQILEADLQGWLGRHETARAGLEKALFLREKQIDPVSNPSMLPDMTWLLDGWLQTTLAPAAIQTRLAALCFKDGDMPAALRFAEAGLVLEPDHHALRCLAIQSARGLLDEDRCARLARGGEAGKPDERWTQALTALQAEMALEEGEAPRAAALIEANIRAIPEETHLLALQARLLARMGDAGGAADALSAALTCLSRSGAQPADPGPDASLWQAYQSTALLSVAEAALDLEQWQQALSAFRTYVEAHPAELHAHLRYARALVLTAERQRLAAALRSVTHAPGESSLSEDSQAVCENALEQAGRAGPTPGINAWRARARAVFQPNLQNAPALAKLPPAADHAAALMAVLRISKNARNAVRVAHHYPESPELLLQVALCYRDLDPTQGLTAAVKAVEREPNQPLNHAGLAALSEAAGDLPAAVQAIENAIALWPDEPEWNVWAAGLCLQTGQDSLALAHWEKALAQRPDRKDYALTLSGLHLDYGNGQRAVEILTQAMRIDPEDKALWMALAHAYLFNGRPETALDCTARAGELDPADPAPRLLSGEIALQLGRPDLALSHARAAQTVAGDLPEVVLFHARTLVQKGQLPDALSILEKSLPSLSSSQSILLERANLVRRLHGAAVALPLLIELAQLYPQDANILTILAQTEADCGDYRSAGRTASAAYHLNPDLPQINLLIGRLQHQAGQLDQAIHFLSEAIRLSYSDVEPYLELAQAYLERREDDQAFLTLQQAIQAAPRDYRPYYRAALVLRENKDYLTAESMLRRAAELAPDDLNIRRQLGAVVALNLVHNSQEVNSIL